MMFLQFFGEKKVTNIRGCRSSTAQIYVGHGIVTPHSSCSYRFKAGIEVILMYEF
jgi:hypothetical protein